MRIKKFTVKNYRSIKSASFELNEKMTVLLAENNAGKSNILRALAGAFHIISRIKEDPEFKFFRNRFLHKAEDVNNEWVYIWEKDYPKNLQKRNSTHSPTEFRLDFLLEESEREEFKKKVSHSINEDLPFKISIYENDKIEISIPKRSYGKTNYDFNKKKDKIAKFISEKIDFVYIPAVRPASLSLDIVADLFRRTISQMDDEDAADYQKALETINKIEKKKIGKIMHLLESSVKGILPNIRSLKINNPIRKSPFMRSLRGDFDIIVDDGNETSLFDKGDGIQSLVAFGIIQYSKQSDKNLSLFVEEPETHLHPGAIKETKKIFDEISQEKQIIITTHSQLFINRTDISANIIIQDNNAKPAQQLSDIRKCLGVTIDDNLINSQIALLVEGKSDAIAVMTILKAKSKKLKEALEKRILTIHYLGGLDHLIERKAFLDGLVFKHVIVFVDADEEGKNAIRRAKNQNIISDNEQMLTTITDFKQSEFEDYYNVTAFENITEISTLSNWRGCLLSNKNRWTIKLKDLFSNNGKDLNADMIHCIKMEIAHNIEQAEDPLDFLDDKKSASLWALVEKLEELLS